MKEANAIIFKEALSREIKDVFARMEDTDKLSTQYVYFKTKKEVLEDCLYLFNTLNS